jgi:hypothetical protein
MDESNFDTLARSLSEARSRRGLTRLLGGLTLGAPLALRGLTETEAKRKKKKKKKRSTTPTTSVPPPVSPPPPPPPPCANGVKDGDETGIDCGGSCPNRCPVGQGCSSQNDCASAICNSNQCVDCSLMSGCSETGSCTCREFDGQRVCVKDDPTPTSCFQCTAQGGLCFRLEGGGTLCYERCQTP